MRVMSHVCAALTGSNNQSQVPHFQRMWEYTPRLFGWLADHYRIAQAVGGTPFGFEFLLLKREPIGVIACLIPFNFPIYTLVRKIAPALITGNAVVVRPSNTTPTSAFAFAQAVIEAGMPAGLINIMAMSHHDARKRSLQLAIPLRVGTKVADFYMKVFVLVPNQSRESF